jgi:DNA polymerase-3 subunit delta'
MLGRVAFTDFPGQHRVIEPLQRSLDRGRLGHAYLLSGADADALEGLARTLAKTLNCLQPQRGASGAAVDCCDACLSCRKIEHGNHSDVMWVRPESKTRVIAIEQVRELMGFVQLTPTEAERKVGIITAADRLNTSAANAFLKTLEEPPRRSHLILLTTEPERILETIESRCLRLRLAGNERLRISPANLAWLREFAAAATGEGGVLARYGLADRLVTRLNTLNEEIEKQLTARSPLETYPDAEPEQRERWEDELKAGIASEYRRQRGELMAAIQAWLHDVWLGTLGQDAGLAFVPELAPAAQSVAARLKPRAAARNLTVLDRTQRQLHTNAQEALVLEIGFLQLAI